MNLDKHVFHFNAFNENPYNGINGVKFKKWFKENVFK